MSINLDNNSYISAPARGTKRSRAYDTKVSDAVDHQRKKIKLYDDGQNQPADHPSDIRESTDSSEQNSGCNHGSRVESNSEDSNPLAISKEEQDKFTEVIRSSLNSQKTHFFERYPQLGQFFANEEYVKVTKKEGQIPVGLGITPKSGVFLHAKKPKGKGHYKKAFSSQWIKPSGEIEPAVYKKLIEVDDDFKMARYVKLTEKEIELQQSFKHESIVKVYACDVYGCNVEGDCTKIAIYEEECDSDLKKANLDYKTKLTVSIDAANAIAYLHDKGYCHNDIKLNNLFVKNGRGKLADFGLCDKIGSSYRGGYKKTYAPEQKEGDANIGNEKTDVYQFGLCLWHLFHPNPPKNHMDPDYEYPCKGSPDEEGLGYMFEGWDYDTEAKQCMGDLVVSCIDPNPKARPSMEKVIAALLEIQTF